MDRNFPGPDPARQNPPQPMIAAQALAAKILAPGGAGAPQNSAPPVASGAAQEPGSISGVIVDPHGAVVAHANVKTVNTDTGMTVAKVTDNTGSYSFSPLPPGPYNVEVEAKGFRNLLQENVHVAAGQMAGLNLKLSAGAGAEIPSLGAAQEAGAISGKIVDPTGALVPRAKVTATNTDDGVQTSSVTDNSGTYSISPLPPGPYNVEIEAKGFQRMLQENVNVKQGKRLA
jgi:hypothetical protein